MEQRTRTMLPIRTDRLVLRDFYIDDLDDVHRYASDPDVTTYLSWGPNTKVQTRQFITQAVLDAASVPRPHYELAIVDLQAAAVVGSCGLICRSTEDACFEVGYCLAREVWGRGYATEMVRALVGFGFEKLAAHRIFGQVVPENPASMRVLEKLGFRQEGRLRRSTRKFGLWRDVLIYAVLEEEWGGKDSLPPLPAGERSTGKEED
jgi:RimJ/RimL family protein N-acetyltransferase